MRTSVKQIGLALICISLAAPHVLFAAGNLMARAVRLEPLEIHGVDGFSVQSYELETGQYYRWRIVGDGRDTYRLLAPDLFANVWVEKLGVDDVVIEASGLRAIELESEAEFDVYFLPLKAGHYSFFVEHLRNTDGFVGSFTVK